MLGGLYQHTRVSALLCRYAAKKQLMDVLTVTSQESARYTQVDGRQMTCWYSKKLHTDSRNCAVNKRNNNRYRSHDAIITFRWMMHKSSLNHIMSLLIYCLLH